MKRHLFALARHNSKLEVEARAPFKSLEFDGFIVDDDTLKFLNALNVAKYGTKRKGIEIPPSFKRARIGFSGNVYVGKNFVVKRPYTVGSKPKGACPTYFLKNKWQVQPVVKVYNDMTVTERKALDKTFPEGAGHDCHWNNFGELKGKLVQFDW